MFAAPKSPPNRWDRRATRVTLTIDKQRLEVFEPNIEALKRGLASVTDAAPALDVTSADKMKNEKLKNTDALVEIVADENFVYVDLMNLVEIAQESGFNSIRIKTYEDLQWEVFDKERYNYFRFNKPTVLTVMADLCPGCRRMRDRFWKSKAILKQLAHRKMALFVGVGSAGRGHQGVCQARVWTRLANS